MEYKATIVETVTFVMFLEADSEEEAETLVHENWTFTAERQDQSDYYIEDIEEVED